MVQTTLGIDDMVCEMCEAHINETIRKNFSVKSAKANRHKKNCVIVSEEELSQDALKKAIAESGYTLTSINSEPYQKKKFLGIF